MGDGVKRPNQQYQSTEGTYSTQRNQTYNKHKKHTQQIPYKKSDKFVRRDDETKIASVRN